MVSPLPSSSSSDPPPPPGPGEPGGAPVPASGASKGKEGKKDDKDAKEPKVVWLKDEEEKLMDVLEEVRAAGAAPENGFKVKTYREIESAISGMAPSGTKAKDHKMVENHWKHMKTCWREVRDIVAQSGFGWNEEEECVEAEASVWDSYADKNPKARKWRKKSLWYYTRVSDLCSEASASGEFALDPSLGTGAPLEEAEGEEVDDEIEEEEDKKGKKRASTSGSNIRPTKRRNGSDQFDRMIDVLSSMAGSDAGPSHEEDPVAAATQTLLDLDSDDLEPDQVASLIGYFASNIGAARAYVTLAANQKPGAEAVRAAYLLQLLASLEY